MKTIIQLSRMMFAALSFMLLLAGCGGGGPAGFATDQVAGKTFAYAKASGTTGATGALTFNADRTWSVALAPYVFSGTWTIDANGNLVCVTTTGGNDTVTYTLLDSTPSEMKVSAVEVNPADPTKPTSYTATFKTAFTAEMIAGQTFSYSSASTKFIKFQKDYSWSYDTYAGTWSIDANGNLVCITITGGTDKTTYTRLNATTDPMSTSASVVRADPSNPGGISPATLTVVVATGA